MIRLAWRQFRSEAVAGVAALVVVAVVLAVTGPHLVEVYRVSPSQVTSTYKDLQTALMAVLLIAPALLGVFFGAPLIARELESGTFRLAWTQGVTRARWLMVKLALVGFASSVLAGGLSLMVAWWANLINIVDRNRFSPSSRDVRHRPLRLCTLRLCARRGHRDHLRRPFQQWRRRSSATSGYYSRSASGSGHISSRP